MKHLLFCCYGLGIGGIEKCLVNLLNALPSTEYKIDVMLMNPEYDSIPLIKKQVSILDSFEYIMNTTDTMGQIQKHGGIKKNLFKTIKYFLFRLWVKFGKRPWLIFKAPKIKYDIAIAYSQNDYSPYFVVDKINANRKVLWYHNGAYEKEGAAYRLDTVYYNKFDYVVTVSQDCRNMLEQKFNFDKGKLVVLRNICDVDAIKNQARVFSPKSFDKKAVHIVTVGRLTREKGADLAVEACFSLIKKGYEIYWHWIGDGNQKNAIQKKITEYGLNNRFILEGNQTNPYPFIKAADIYVQTSYYEAYSTTVTEARVLRKAIVVTDVGGMREQITNGASGLIVEIDVREIVKAIETLLVDVNWREKLSCAAELKKFEMTKVIKQYEESVFR